MAKQKKLSKEQKARRRCARKVARYALIQLLIIVMFLFMLHQNRIATPQNTREVTEVVEGISLLPGLRGYRFYVHTASGFYRFNSNTNDGDSDLMRSWSKRVQVGDTLSMSYMGKLGIAGMENVVVAVSNGTEVLYTIENYNYGRIGSNCYIVGFSLFLEANFWFLLGLKEHWFFGRKPQKKKKKKTENGSLP